jgi:hypothetical protein
VSTTKTTAALVIRSFLFRGTGEPRAWLDIG